MPSSKRIDQRRTLGGNQVVGDEVGDVLNVLALMADGRRQNRGRENTDAVGAGVLKEPGNGCEYGGTQIVRVEQSRIAARGMPRPSPPARVGQSDLVRIRRFAVQKALELHFRLSVPILYCQPVRTLRYKEAAEQHQAGGIMAVPYIHRQAGKLGSALSTT